ncbi:MAG: hypothetical protein L0Y56_12295, partial [Nitrospira sp.]|nr:hypothetical protein [Nitrospira sp.]
PHASLEWQEIRLQGQDSLAVRATKKLKNDELLITQFAGTRLRLELDRVPLWRGNHVGLKQLAEDFAQYLYLPRLKDPEVLIAAIENGLALMTWMSDSFAYADSWDTEKGRYRGLRAGQITRVTLEGESLLVKPEIAAQQLQADAATKPVESPPVYIPGATSIGAGKIANGSPESVTPPILEPSSAKRPKRFHGSIDLDATRLSRDASKIAEEVLQHLAGLLGTQVEVTLEIHVEIPDGTPDYIVRTVTENCRTLRFKTFGFEER